jgi:hypothetical protein
VNQQQNRGYIRSDDDIWKLWRELILPKISYLSILKLISIDQQSSLPIFYFCILLDYQFRSFVHPTYAAITPEILDISLEEAEKLAVRYRKNKKNTGENH